LRPLPWFEIKGFKDRVILVEGEIGLYPEERSQSWSGHGLAGSGTVEATKAGTGLELLWPLGFDQVPMGQRVDQQRSGFVGKRPPFLAGRVTMGLSDLGGAAWRRPRNWENLRCFGAQGVRHG